MASCPVRAEQVLESHGRPLRITLSRPSDCAKYEITLDVALHFGPEDHSCAEKLNKNNDQVGRETLQLFKSGFAGSDECRDANKPWSHQICRRTAARVSEESMQNRGVITPLLL